MESRHVVKPSELMADLPAPPGHEREFRLYARLLVRYFADHIYDATLESGEGISDPMNFKRLFEQCAAVLGPPVTLRSAPRDHRCPECHHEHEGRGECKVYLGEGRFCLCEAKVTA